MICGNIKLLKKKKYERLYLRTREPSNAHIKIRFSPVTDDDTWRYGADKRETFIFKNSRTIQHSNIKAQFPLVIDDNTWSV